jgi:uncharacterized protein YndB with AHSA1/START domain
MQVDVDADRATVHRALSTQDGIRSWWSNHTDGPTNGQLRVSFVDAPLPFEFTVARDDDSRVDWVTGGFPPPWAGTTVRWDLADNPDGPGTRLVFHQLGFDPENPVIAVVTPIWAQIVGRLKGYVESGTPQPFFDFAAAAR